MSSNILVACEESQAVVKELRRLDHNAFSCDLLDCSGGHPEWHIQQDVLPLLGGGCEFDTSDGKRHSLNDKWDAIVAFPPCTHLAVSGARHFEEKRHNGKQYEAIKFFCQFLYADCDRILIENPVNIISGKYIPTHFPDLAELYHLPIKPTQIIQPFWFGDHARKTTCLWLKNLPKLSPTDIVDYELVKISNGDTYSVGASARYARDENGKILSWNDPRTARIRSKTFPGIARAIAEQMFGSAHAS